MYVLKSMCFFTEVPDVPHGVDVGVAFVENNEEWGRDDALCQCLTVQVIPEESDKFSVIRTERTDYVIFTHLYPSVNNVLFVKFHPVLQLPCDVLIPPLSQVGDDDPRVEGTCVGPHPQLLNILLLEVQVTHIVILAGKKTTTKIHYSIILMIHVLDE